MKNFYIFETNEQRNQIYINILFFKTKKVKFKNSNETNPNFLPIIYSDFQLCEIYFQKKTDISLYVNAVTFRPHIPMFDSREMIGKMV